MKRNQFLHIALAVQGVQFPLPTKSLYLPIGQAEQLEAALQPKPLALLQLLETETLEQGEQNLKLLGKSSAGRKSR